MEKTKAIFRYLIIFILLYILQCASIRGLHPFAFGMLFSLAMCNQKLYAILPLYILSNFLAIGTLDSVIISLTTCLVLVATFFVHYRFKRRINLLLLGIYACLSQAGLLYYNAYSSGAFFDAIFTVIIGLIAMYAYLYILQSLIKKGIRRKYSIDELICLGVTIFAVGVGLYSIPYGEYISLGIMAFCLLFVGFCLGGIHSLFLSIFFGLALSFSSGEYLYLSHFLFLSLSGFLGTSLRIYTGLSIILLDILSGLYFMPYYSITELFSVLAGVVLFLIIPNKYIKAFKQYIITDKEDTAVRVEINRNRQAICRRLGDLSDVFFDMKNVYYDLIKGVNDIDDVSQCLTDDIKQRLCANCSKRQTCINQKSIEITASIKKLVHFAYERGRISIVDLPPSITSECCRLGALISTVNSVLDEYKANIQSSLNLDEGKIMLGEQMWGVSQIMKSLSKEISQCVTFDVDKENLILDELINRGVVCSEVIVYKMTQDVYNVTMIVKSKNIDNSFLSKMVSRCMSMPMEVLSKSKSEKVGYDVIVFTNCTHYDIVFGSSRAIKDESETSGDTFSVLKLNHDKILLALSDGMGSGVRAERVSKLAISMVEDFYKAGFENDLIITNVNKLLNFSGEEVFSALDIAVVDLVNGTCDLIKVGSPQSFIKSQNTTTEIEACAMPMGILDDLKPSIKSFVFKDNDMLILLTDGIVDSFSTRQELNEYITSLEGVNPQTIANNILNKALELSNNIPQDDMTVLVCRIFTKF